MSSFFYGYVITQIPFGILAKRYGNIYFLGIGMMINSVFGLLVPVAANMGIWWLIAVRFIQGLGEVSIELKQVQRVSKRIFVTRNIVHNLIFGNGQKCRSSLTFVPCIGFQFCTFLVRALLSHVHTLFWQNGSP